MDTDALAMHMVNIVRRDKDHGRDVRKWIGEYEMRVVDLDTEEEFVFSSIGDECEEWD